MITAGHRASSRDQTAHGQATAEAVQAWFAAHVSVDDKPYTLDLDQARAVADQHHNTLITARAGSGKTRVIVAKVAYLVGQKIAKLDEILIFMFNRTAATEVNQRIAAIQIDGHALVDEPTQCKIASTFHKFALDINKRCGEHPQIISEATQQTLVQNLLRQVIDTRRTSPQEFQELLTLTNNFIARAGQKFPGSYGLKRLQAAVKDYCTTHMAPEFRRNRYFHQIGAQVYQNYLAALQSPQIDFNQLMHRATTLLSQQPAQLSDLTKLKFIMIDEYQDFSFLFFELIQVLRVLAPLAKLFAVGDDWQAINRFAGSDVDYFLRFADYFSHDYINIPLATNYRSARRIVEHANHFMLQNYDPQAIPAIPHQKKSGKIYYVNPEKTKFDATDIAEDALGDGAYQKVLQQLCHAKVPLGAARLLKTVTKIIRHNASREILLLHRHNFTSFDGITLEIFTQALQIILERQGIMTGTQFQQQVRCMTMHKSKGLEAEVVLLLELNHEIVRSSHPHATIFQLFGDTRAAEQADQSRLLYVAITRAKHKLYLLSSDRNAPV